MFSTVVFFSHFLKAYLNLKYFWSLLYMNGKNV